MSKMKRFATRGEERCAEDRVGVSHFDELFYADAMPLVVCFSRRFGLFLGGPGGSSGVWHSLTQHGALGACFCSSLRVPPLSHLTFI